MQHKMTEENWNHAEKVQQNAIRDILTKYKAGVEEHGGSLPRKGIRSLIAKEMRNEAIDQVVYTDCLTEGLEKIRNLAAARLILEEGDANMKDIRAFQEIIKILDGELSDIK